MNVGGMGRFTARASIISITSCGPTNVGIAAMLLSAKGFGPFAVDVVAVVIVLLSKHS